MARKPSMKWWMRRAITWVGNGRGMTAAAIKPAAVVRAVWTAWRKDPHTKRATVALEKVWANSTAWLPPPRERTWATVCAKAVKWSHGRRIESEVADWGLTPMWVYRWWQTKPAQRHERMHLWTPVRAFVFSRHLVDHQIGAQPWLWPLETKSSGDV